MMDENVHQLRWKAHRSSTVSFVNLLYITALASAQGRNTDQQMSVVLINTLPPSLMWLLCFSHQSLGQCDYYQKESRDLHPRFFWRESRICCFTMNTTVSCFSRMLCSFIITRVTEFMHGEDMAQDRRSSVVDPSALMIVLIPQTMEMHTCL